MEFNKLCIYPIKGIAKHIFYMAEYVANGKNLKIKHIDWNFNKKQTAYCPELPLGIISFNGFVNIETINVTFSDVEVNEYELIGTKSNELVNPLKQLGLPHFIWLIRQILLRDKLRSNNLNKKMILYLTLNKEKLDYMNFEKFKDSLLGLKEIMNETENAEDECELKIWKLKKTERKKLKEFGIKKEEELKWELLRVTNFLRRKSTRNREKKCNNKK